MNKREKALCDMLDSAGLVRVSMSSQKGRHFAIGRAPNGKEARFSVSCGGSDDFRGELNELARMRRFAKNNQADTKPAPGVPSTLPSPVAETRREFAPPKRTVTITVKPRPAPPLHTPPAAKTQPTMPAPAPTTKQQEPTPTMSKAATNPSKGKPPQRMDRAQFLKLVKWAEKAGEYRGKGKTLADLCAIASAELGLPTVQASAMEDALDYHNAKDVIAKPAKRTPTAILAETLVSLLQKFGEQVPADLAALAKKASAEAAA